MAVFDQFEVNIDKYEARINLPKEIAGRVASAFWALQLGWVKKIHFGHGDQLIKFEMGDKNTFELKERLFKIDLNAIGYILSQLNYLVFFGVAQASHFHVEFEAKFVNECNSFDFTITFDEFREPLTPDEAKKIMGLR